MDRFVRSILLLAVALWNGSTLAETCAEASYNLTTQEEVNALGATGCDLVTGDLTVVDSLDIYNLEPLVALARIEGALQITGNTALLNLDGLLNIARVGSVEISDNAIMTNIDGLTGLVRAGALTISTNPDLANLDGLGKLVSVSGDMTIDNNPLIENLDGLTRLIRVGGTLTIEANDALQDLDGLANMTQIGTALTIKDNIALTNIQGLSGLSAITEVVASASALEGGSISPASQQVLPGLSAQFTITEDEGYSFSNVTGTCPQGSFDGSNYTTGLLTEDCTVIATFSANNASDYCAGAPAEVICDPDADGRLNPGGNMDSWVGLTWGFDNTPIPNGKTVAYPFLANAGATGGDGTMIFSNNMPDLTTSHYYWKGWFSETPGGPVLNNDAPYCRKFSANPNPQEMRWDQSADPNRFACDLGQAERVLYFNMEVACYEELPSNVSEDEKV